MFMKNYNHQLRSLLKKWLSCYEFIRKEVTIEGIKENFLKEMVVIKI